MLRCVTLGLVAIPHEADVAAFLLSGGRTECRPSKPSAMAALNLEGLLEEYLAQAANGSLESKTESMLAIHARHLTRTLGPSLRLSKLDTAALQRYVDKQAESRGIKGRSLSSVTIKEGNWSLSELVEARF